MKKISIACVFIFLFGVIATADVFDVDPANALFAIVTHKSGPMAKMAHDHLIYTDKWKTEVSVDGDDMSTAKFQLQFPVTSLRVNIEDDSKKWYPKIHALAAQEKPFTKPSPKDRKLIVKHIVGKKQLNAAKYAEIKAELKSVLPKESTRGKTKFAYEAVIALTVCGKTVEYPFAANIDDKDGKLKIEAIGEYKFTDFGIKPYSAFFGAVGNKDRFYVYVNFSAARSKKLAAASDF